MRAGVLRKTMYQPQVDPHVRRVLKPGGTIWISGTLHNIYSIGMALQQERYKIINITWKKQTAA